MMGGTWIGIEEALAALNETVSEVAASDVIAKAMLAAAKPVVEGMKDRAISLGLYRTGEMVESMAVARVTDDPTPGVVAIEIGPKKGARHSYVVRFWELGTSTLPAKPFMRTTWDEHESTWSSAVAAELAKKRYQKPKEKTWSREEWLYQMLGVTVK